MTFADYNNNSVEVDSICMDISEPHLIVLSIPKTNSSVDTSVQLDLRITNNRSTPLPLNLYKNLIPELLTSDGQALQRQVATEQEKISSQMNIPQQHGWRFKFTSLFSNFLSQFKLSNSVNIDEFLVESTQNRYRYLPIRKHLFYTTIPISNMLPKESNDTNTVEVDGIQFEILLPKQMLTLPVEKPGYEVSVQIGIQITNNTLTPFRFSFYGSLIPELLMPNERIVRGDYSTTFLRRRFESDFPLTMPGENIIFFPNAKLFWIRPKVLGLEIAAGDGGVWIFENLTTGRYKVRFILSNQNTMATVDDGVSKEMKLIENVWIGTVSTPFVQLNLG